MQNSKQSSIFTTCQNSQPFNNTFWNWFKANADDLQSNKYPNDKLDELDRRVLNFGLRWEVGPGKTKENSFTISPSGDNEKIELTKEFIRLSPTIDSWEFYNFKQPKVNWDKLELPEDNINITADKWRYILLKYKDGKKEILIKGDSLNTVDTDLKLVVAEMVLTNLIGEERMMTELDFVDVLSPDDNTYDLHDIKELIRNLDYIKNGA
jgi:hypothetical protein